MLPGKLIIRQINLLVNNLWLLYIRMQGLGE
jgi:hypothetical protein